MPLSFSKYILLLFSALSLTLTGFPAVAAVETSSFTRYWNANVTSGLDGDETLALEFYPDEEQCQQRYGKQWWTICQRRTGMNGRPGQKLSLSPKTEGDWRWVSDSRLLFAPAHPWAAGKTYTVTIGDSALPSDTRLKNSTVSFSTAPLQIRAHGQFRADPYQPKTMAVTGRLEFNYPVDRESVMKRLNVSAGTTTRAPLLGKPVYTWDNQDNASDTLIFSIPVLRLLDETSMLTLRVDAGVTATSGGTPGTTQDFSIALPGRSELFELKSIDKLVATRDDLRARQTVMLHFSLPIAPKDVARHIEIKLLPRHRQASADSSTPPYTWWSTQEINAEVLKRSQSVRPVLEDGADIPVLDVPLSLDKEIEPGRSLYITVRNSLKEGHGLQLKKDFSALISLPEFPEELRIMQRGAVLPLSGDRTLSIYSRNLDAVEYELARIRTESINHFLSPLLSGIGSFAQPELTDNQLNAVTTVQRGVLPLTRHDAGSAQFSSLKLDGENKARSGLFVVKLSGIRNKQLVATDTRFVMMTDIGLIRKEFSDHTGEAYAVSLTSGTPLAELRIHVLGANGLPVFSGVTSKNGTLSLPDLRGMQNERRPVAILAECGEDLTVLPYLDPERNINYSRFETGGRTSSIDNLSACLFGERDLYRAGETVHFGYIFRDGNWKNLEGMTLRADIIDPRGNKMLSQKIKLDNTALGELSWQIPQDALTGMYRLDLGLDDDTAPLLASSMFNVTVFQPDTLNLTVRYEKTPGKGWLQTTPQSAEQTASVHLRNMFGAPASGHILKASAFAEPAGFIFREYPGWTFYDAAPLPETLRWRFADTNTKTDGSGSFTIPGELSLAGTAWLTLQVHGLEAGSGRGVSSGATMLVSPLPHVLGWKSNANLNYLPRNGHAEVSLLAITPDLQPAALGPISLTTLNIHSIRTLIKDNTGQYRYDTLRQEKKVSSKQMTLGQKGLSVNLDLSEPGEHILEIRNTDKKILARIPYIVAGEMPHIDEELSPSLSVRIDKKDYAPGEEVQVFLSTPYKGAGLITIEQDKVYASSWFYGEAGDMVRSIRLPEHLEGRAYINVICFRSPDDTDIFTKPLAAAVVPLTVNMNARDLDLKLNVKGTEDGPLPIVRPGSQMELEVSAKRPAKAIIFAVDEGILQLTSYTAPNPLKDLLEDRALEVVTSQYLDLLMPEYSLFKKALSAYGGGEGIALAKAMDSNPFRRAGEPSAIFWSGVLPVGPEKHTLTVPVPQSFSGQWRIMAVAASGDGLSSARTDVYSQAEIVIQPALPLFAAPGDTFEAAVTLTDMNSSANAQQGRVVRLELSTDSDFVLEGGTPELTLRHGIPETVRVPLRTPDTPGNRKLTFRAVPVDSASGNSVSRTIQIAVRPAMALGTRIRSGSLSAGKTLDIQLQPALYAEEATLEFSLSALPLPAAYGLAEWLSNYPYGCTEQVISAAFPAVIMLSNPQLVPSATPEDRKKWREQVTEAISILQARHDGDGGFAIWSSGYRGDLQLSAYAADFLTTAQEAGINVPGNLIHNTLERLKIRASEPPFTQEEARTAAYAAWVLTRNGVLTANIMSTLSAALQHMPGWEQDITAAYMAGCWQLMMKKDTAARLLNGSLPGREHPIADRASYLCIVAGQFPDQLRCEKTQKVLHELLELIGAEELPVTAPSALAARALLEYSKSLAMTSPQAVVSVTDTQGRTQTLTLSNTAVPALRLQGKAASSAANLRLNAADSIYWQLSRKGFEMQLPAEAQYNGMEIHREFRNADGTPLKDIRLGDEVIVAIRARAYASRLNNVAITDLLPAGLELEITAGGRLTELRTTLGMKQDEQTMIPDHAERLEDRVLLFTSLDTQEEVFLYRARAIARGTFVIPPLQAEAMATPSIRAHTRAETMTIH